MKHTGIRRVGIALAVLLAGSRTGFAEQTVPFGDILKNPARLDGQSVSVVGLAHVTSNRFYLVQDVKAAARSDPAQAIFISVVGKEANDTKYDNRWVKIYGIVNARFHGDLENFPCGIVLKKIEVLRRPPQKEWRNDAGWFRNDTRGLIHIALSADGYVYDQSYLDPGGYVPFSIREGAWATIKSSDGGVISRSRMFVPKRTGKSEEPANRVFFYSVQNHGLKFVPEAEAKTWRVPSLPPS
jgi:hypothetical protein